MFRSRYANVFEGDPAWSSLPVPEGDRFAWDPKSTYIKHPPFFENMPPTPAAIEDIRSARVLAVLGDSVTTDHISPAGSIPADGPAGKVSDRAGRQTRRLQLLRGAARQS